MTWYRYVCPKCGASITLAFTPQDMACSRSHRTAKMVLESPESDPKPSSGADKGKAPGHNPGA